MNVFDGSVIAIDGPSASGKSTVSRRVAAELGFIYVDSGALYRGMTWGMLQLGVDVKDADAVLAAMPQVGWTFYIEERVLRFKVNGEIPGDALRAEPVRERVSDIAAIPEVRSFIVAQLRKVSEFGSLVMEGRDIGSVVFPETEWKYYLDADPEERARRRFAELQVAEGHNDEAQVLQSLQRRDKKDTTRKTAPLQIALGATVINTTGMSIDEVVAFIVRELREKAME